MTDLARHAPALAMPHTALVHDRPQQTATSHAIAGVASALVPGLGQLVQGRFLPAASFFLTATVGGWFWFLIIPGLLAATAYVWSIWDAATYRD